MAPQFRRDQPGIGAARQARVLRAIGDAAFSVPGRPSCATLALSFVCRLRPAQFCLAWTFGRRRLGLDNRAGLFDRQGDGFGRDDLRGAARSIPAFSTTGGARRRLGGLTSLLLGLIGAVAQRLERHFDGVERRQRRGLAG